MGDVVLPERGVSRVTVFPLEGLLLAYTSWSSDSRGLGDVGIVGVCANRSGAAVGDELWATARSMWGRIAKDQEVAEWILTQALRCRVVHSPRYLDLLEAKWEANLSKQHSMGKVYANHEVLATGSMTLPGVTLPEL